jgi:hypothetical protein
LWLLLWDFWSYIYGNHNHFFIIRSQNREGSLNM